MSQHLDQIASSIQRAVQNVITRGLQDPRVRGLISITRVEVTPDLSDATIYISVLPAEHETLTVHGLKSAAAHIRSKLGSAVQLRRVPRLHFRLDHSLKKQADIFAALADERVQDDVARAADAPESMSADRHQDVRGAHHAEEE